MVKPFHSFLLKFSFFLTFSILTQEVWCQGVNKIDSLENFVKNNKNESQNMDAYIELCQASYLTNSPVLSKYCDLALEKISSIKVTKEKSARLYASLGVVLVDTRLNKAKETLKTALTLSKSIKNDSLTAANHLVISLYYTRNPNIDSSNYYLTLATQYFEKIEDSVSLSYAYFNFMNNYNDVNNIDKTIEYGEKTLQYSKALNDEMLYNYCKVAMAFTYLKNREIDDLAQSYINDAIKFAEKNQNFGLLTDINLAIGAKKLIEKKYNESIESYNKALSYTEVTKDTMKISTAILNLGKAYFQLQNFSKAESYLLNSLKFNKNTDTGLSECYLTLSMIYLASDFKKSQLYKSKYDSITNVIQEKNSQDLLIKYESLEKEKEIEDLKLKKANQELLIQKNNNKTLILTALAGSALLILLIVIVFSRYRQSSLKQKVEIEQQRLTNKELKIKQQEKEMNLMFESLKNNQKIIKNLKEKFSEKTENEEHIHSILESFEQSYVSEKQWDNIFQSYDIIQNGFVTNLKKLHPNITKSEIKMSILLSLDYSNSGMSEILNITIDGVKKAKQRLKKKGII